MKRILLVALVLLTAAGCAPWSRSEGHYSIGEYTVELPQGWMKSNTTNHLFLSKDGVNLQAIVFFDQKVDEPLRYTKKLLSKGMLPQEAAEVVFDNLMAGQKFQNLDIRENKPAKLGNVPAFRAVLSFKDSDNLKYKSIYYGFIKDDHFYGLYYIATSRHYFDEDVKTFDKLVRSFKVSK